MNRKVQIYVEGDRIELFSDEKVNVSSSVQNISDISKIYTDFSTSFTIPASDRNNAIFEHYYNNDLDGQINHNLRREAWIEIDLVPFRKGKLQLEKANIKDGRAYSYSVTFYGDILTLKDIFGDLKLKDLDFSSLSFVYNGANIQEHIEDNLADYDVKYPLISSKRVWQWNEPTTPLDNIDTVTGAINKKELFPAIRIKKIFDFIENQLGVTFQGLFLNNEKFKRAFLYCKNAEKYTLISDIYDVDFTTIQSDYNSNIDTVPFNLTTNAVSLFWRYDIYNVVEAYWVSPQPTFQYWVERKHKLRMDISPSDQSSIYYIDVYKNGLYFMTYSNNNNHSVWFYEVEDDITLLETFTFKVRAENSMTIQIDIAYLNSSSYVVYDPTYVGLSQYVVKLLNDVPLLAFSVKAHSSTYLTGNVNFANYMPDIKIGDFFSNVLKEFNLTCYGIGNNTWQIETLEDWYNKGTIYDITTFTTLETIDVERIKLYKRISFEYEKSESFMNKEYAMLFAKEYGNLNLDFPYDGSDYVIKTMFENLMFNHFTNTDIQVGYCLGMPPEYKPYIPKPIILYFNGYTQDQPYLHTETGTYLLARTQKFGQDLEIGSINYSLNWGADTSTMYLMPILNSMYETYYGNYLKNMFKLKNRLIKVKCVLPLKLLSELKLNDRLIIRDKRYIINEMNTELTSGEVNLTLINDFRTIKTRSKKDWVVSAGETLTISKVFPILFPNGTALVTIDTTGSGIISVSETTVTKDTDVTFEFPVNTNLKYQLKSEDSSYFPTSESGERITNEEWKTPFYNFQLTYDNLNGTTDVEIITIQQDCVIW